MVTLKGESEMELFNGVNKITVSPTRFAGLGYANTNPVGKACWRFVDLHDTDRKAVVGAVYYSKVELLADLDRYAKTWGY